MYNEKDSPLDCLFRCCLSLLECSNQLSHCGHKLLSKIIHCVLIFLSTCRPRLGCFGIRNSQNMPAASQLTRTQSLLWSRITKYIGSLRSQSTKCSRTPPRGFSFWWKEKHRCGFTTGHKQWRLLVKTKVTRLNNLVTFVLPVVTLRRIELRFRAWKAPVLTIRR